MGKLDLLTVDNCALLLIDFQPATTIDSNSVDRTLLTNNVIGLAKAAKVYQIPVVLTTIDTAIAGPFYPAVQQLFPNHPIIDRHDTNAWADPHFRDAVIATGKKKVVLAGLWTEVCVAFTALSMLNDGYEVYFVEDACAGVSESAHRMGIERMIQAGAIPLTWFQVLAELNRTAQTSPELLQGVGDVVFSAQQLIANRYMYGLHLAPEKLGQAH